MLRLHFFLMKDSKSPVGKPLGRSSLQRGIACCTCTCQHCWSCPLPSVVLWNSTGPLSPHSVG